MEVREARDGYYRSIPDSGFGISAQEVMRNFGGQRGVQADEDGTYYDAELMIAEFLMGMNIIAMQGRFLFDAIYRAKADNAEIDSVFLCALVGLLPQIGHAQTSS